MAVVDLTQGELNIVVQLIAEHVPASIWFLHGPRVRGDNDPNADLNLAVRLSPSDSAIRIERLRNALDESELPFDVSVMAWDDIVPARRELIQKSARPISETSGFICAV